MNKLNLPAQALGNQTNLIEFILSSFLDRHAFVTLGLVVAVDESAQTVDVKPMLHSFTEDETKVEKEIIYGVRYFRHQRGTSAIIMDPVAGDIGVLAVCDGDVTNIMATAAPALPASRRKHNMADAIYFGGVGSINQEPQQYIAFLDEGIFVVSPSQVAVLSPLVQVLTQTAIIQADTVSVTATTIDLTGRTTINGDTDVIGNLKVSGTTTTNGLSAGAGGGTATFSGTINHTGTYNLYGSFYHYNGTMVSLGRNVSGTHTHPYTSGQANTGVPNT